MDKVKILILVLNVYPICMIKGHWKNNLHYVDKVHVNLYFKYS